MKIYYTSFVIILFLSKVSAQNTTILPNQGISVPQFTTSFINSLNTQPKGTVVFDSDLNVMKYWDGAVWQTMSGGGGGSSSFWQANGNNISNTNSANVGIGTASPTSLLQIGSVGSSGYGGNHIAFGNGTDASGIAQNSNTGTVNWYSTTNISLMPRNGNGSVGIGTALPSHTLDVNGDGSFYGNALSYNSTLRSYVGGGLSVYSGSLPFYGLLMDGTSIQAKLRLTSDANSSLSLNPFGGNVGIGTTSPTYKFTINSGTVSDWGMMHTNGTVFLGSFIYSNGIAEFGTRSNHPLYLFTNNSDAPPAMALATNGNVGIGTTNPTYKLAVNGTIRAKEVIVETGWADYVFEKNFTLPKLTDVEKFISKNHHLPELPSAEEIQKNGAKLAELTTKMMQKIEEQTLYIIELQKQIDELKASSKK